jgi:hypothetical protein
LERKILDFLATTMSRAIVGTGCAGTCLTFISRKALALAGLTITDSTVGTFRIFVVVTELIRSVDPSELKGTNTLRTVTTQAT